MSGVTQATFMNQRSFGPPPPGAIGSAYEGGFYAGDISVAGNGVASHHLVIAPKSSGENSSKQWKTSNTPTAGTSSVIDGLTNSANMNNASHPAAEFCEGLTIGTFSDWYMPAKNEMEVCYFNLKPGTQNNNTSSGTNPNAVPARAVTYTNSPKVPDQTLATDFQTGNTQAIAPNRFWNSTQATDTTGQTQFFDNGEQAPGNKVDSMYVRAVRRVAV